MKLVLLLLISFSAFGNDALFIQELSDSSDFCNGPYLDSLSTAEKLSMANYIEDSKTSIEKHNNFVNRFLNHCFSYMIQACEGNPTFHPACTQRFLPTGAPPPVTNIQTTQPVDQDPVNSSEILVNGKNDSVPNQGTPQITDNNIDNDEPAQKQDPVYRLSPQPLVSLTSRSSCQNFGSICSIDGGDFYGTCKAFEQGVRSYYRGSCRDLGLDTTFSSNRIRKNSNGYCPSSAPVCAANSQGVIEAFAGACSITNGFKAFVYRSPAQNCNSLNEVQRENLIKKSR